MVVLLATAAACSAQLLAPYAHYAHYAPALRTQYHAQDSLGQYSFGYTGGPSAKHESSAGGVTQGGFSYVDAHGLVQSRSYVADPVNGFRVAGSDIPVDANTPLATPVAHPLAVLARKRRHVYAPVAYAHPIAHPIAYAHPMTHPSAAHPADTAEVAAAKAAHYQQYNFESFRNAHLVARKKRSVYAYAHPVAPLAYHATPIAYAAPIAAPVAPLAYAAPSPMAASSQFHAQDELGQYSYGYSNPLSSKAESRSANGVTQGGYSYVDAHGLVQSASYVSDPANGFRVAATNLPVAPVAA